MPFAVSRTDVLDSVAVTCDGAATDSTTFPAHPPVDASLTGTATDVPAAAAEEVGTLIE